MAKSVARYLTLGSVAISALLMTCSLSSAKKISMADDESGTLVMVARTNSAVIISVDSQINSGGSFLHPPRIWTDGRRKLVDVGKRGACALDGWIGNEHLYLAPAASLRNWAKNHPIEGPDSAIDNLLQEAALTWDQVGFHPGQTLPSNRKVGDSITTLLCGDIADGHPVIIRGETFVKPDFSAGYRRLPAEMGDVLYVDGVIQNWELPILFLSKPSSMHSKISSKYLLALINVSKDLQSNSPAIKSFKISQRVGHAGAGSRIYQSIWTLSTVSNLFRPFYKTVKQNYGDLVGPPNQVRIILPCGRFATQVSVDPWPTCPVRKLIPR